MFENNTTGPTRHIYARASTPDSVIHIIQHLLLVMPMVLILLIAHETALAHPLRTAALLVLLSAWTITRIIKRGVQRIAAPHARLSRPTWTSQLPRSVAIARAVSFFVLASWCASGASEGAPRMVIVVASAMTASLVMTALRQTAIADASDTGAEQSLFSFTAWNGNPQFQTQTHHGNTHTTPLVHLPTARITAYGFGAALITAAVFASHHSMLRFGITLAVLGAIAGSLPNAIREARS